MNLSLKRGFTLIEIVLVVALITLIAGAGLQLLTVGNPTERINADTFAVVTALYRARTLAVTARGDSAWGVFVHDDAVTVFKGGAYAERDESYDTVVQYDASLMASGSTEIVFAKRTGLPAEAATVSLGFGAETSYVTVNEFGIIGSHVE